MFPNPFLNGELNWISNIIQRTNEISMEVMDGVTGKMHRNLTVTNAKLLKLKQSVTHSNIFKNF